MEFSLQLYLSYLREAFSKPVVSIIAEVRMTTNSQFKKIKKCKLKAKPSTYIF